jgi:hypothetical protein
MIVAHSHSNGAAANHEIAWVTVTLQHLSVGEPFLGPDRSRAPMVADLMFGGCSSGTWRRLRPCSPSWPGSSGDGALADVTLDLVLRGNVPSVFRQSPEDSERRPSPAIGPTRGQAYNHEQKS